MAREDENVEREEGDGLSAVSLEKAGLEVRIIFRLRDAEQTRVFFEAMYHAIEEGHIHLQFAGCEVIRAERMQ